ncbi:MAG: hypothetical protein LBV67_10380 [Streptococcaceae bacterium]|nr:hypothetical protein [Streptococcaceae bacterium]
MTQNKSIASTFLKDGLKVQQMLVEMDLDEYVFADELGISHSDFKKILAGLWNDKLIYSIINKRLLPQYETFLSEQQRLTVLSIYLESKNSFSDPFAVKLLRLYFEMTQIQFAKILGVDVQSIKYWETGRSKPNANAEILLTLLLFQKITPKDLLDIAENNHTEIAFG